MGKGTHTREYGLFHSNIATLTDGIKSELSVFTTKVLERNLIGQDAADKALILHNPPYGRASELLRALLNRVQQDSEEFYIILGILWDIPVLKKLATTVDPSYKGPSSRRNGASAVTGSVSSSTTSTQSGSKLLGIDDKKVVAGALVKIAADWESIALALDIQDDDLRIVKKDNAETKPRLFHVITMWLNGKGGRRTWSYLCEALRGPLVQKSLVADEIEREYCS